MSAAPPTLKERLAPHRLRAARLLLFTVPLLSTGCTSPVRQDNATPSPGIKDDEPNIIATVREGTPRIEYDERGRIKGLFGLRTNPSGDPTCKLEEHIVDFVNIERDQYLVFSLPSTFHVWVELGGEMQKMFTDPQDAKAREFLSGRKKYRMKAYACDAIGHTTYETVSVELLN